MIPRARLVGAILLGLALFTYGATSEVAWLFLFAYLIWGLAAASFAYAVWNAHGIRSGLRVAGVEAGDLSPVHELPEALFRDAPLPAPAFEGDSVILELALGTEGGQRGPARLSASVGGIEIEAGTGLVPGGGWRAERRLGPLKRGPIIASDLLLEAGDPLGFFRGGRRSEGGEVAAVFPLFTSLSEQVRVREVESVLTATRPGHGNELYGVREYRSGDPLRRIHWKTSARRGELVVREFEPPGLRVVALLLEESPAGPEVADQLARLAASEAWDCLRSGGRVTLWAPGCEALPVEEGRSLWSVLEWLARYPALPADPVGIVPHANEAIGFCSTAGGALATELDRLVARGVDVRAWVVGDASVAVPHRRAGLSWPL